MNGGPNGALDEDGLPEDDVAELIRGAGAPPELAPAELARARSVVHDAWSRSVRPPARREGWWAAAGQLAGERQTEGVSLVAGALHPALADPVGDASERVSGRPVDRPASGTVEGELDPLGSPGLRGDLHPAAGELGVERCGVEEALETGPQVMLVPLEEEPTRRTTERMKELLERARERVLRPLRAAIVVKLRVKSRSPGSRRSQRGRSGGHARDGA